MYYKIIFQVMTEDIKSDLKALSSNFDFSNPPKSHELFDDSYRVRLFRFKEELGLKPILRYVGLASKVYCLQIACCHSFTTCCRCSDQDESNQKEWNSQRNLFAKALANFQWIISQFYFIPTLQHEMKIWYKMKGERLEFLQTFLHWTFKQFFCSLSLNISISER